MKILFLTEGFASGLGIEYFFAISIPSKARFRFGLGSHVGSQIAEPAAPAQISQGPTMVSIGTDAKLSQFKIYVD